MAEPIEQLVSQTVHMGDGVNTVWNFTFAGGYLDRSHVRARYLDGAFAPVQVQIVPSMFLGPFQLSITPPIAAGVELTIYRATPKELPIVNFVDNGVLTERSLDVNAMQAVFIGAESADAINRTLATTAGIVAAATASVLAASVGSGAAAASAVAAATSASSASASAASSASSATIALGAIAAASSATTNAAEAANSAGAALASASQADASADAAALAQAATATAQTAVEAMALGGWAVRVYTAAPSDPPMYHFYMIVPPTDLIAPVMSTFGATSGAATPVPITAFTATDAGGVTGYWIGTSATTPALNDAGWSVTPIAEYSAPVGTMTLYGRVRDAAGNISAAMQATVTVVPPVYWSVTDRPTAYTTVDGTGKVLSANQLHSGRGGRGVSSGIHQLEVVIGDSSICLIGIGLASASLDNYPGSNSASWGYYSPGTFYHDGVTATRASPWEVGDVIGIVVDMDAGTLTFYKNGVSQGVAFTGITGTVYPMFGCGTMFGGGATATMQSPRQFPVVGARLWH